MPAFGQVHGDVAAAVARDAGSDGDQLAADGRAAGFREEGAPARQPAARVRLWQMAARVSHAAFAGKCPDGR
jgi:hypothetical protein